MNTILRSLIFLAGFALAPSANAAAAEAAATGMPPASTAAAGDEFKPVDELKPGDEFKSGDEFSEFAVSAISKHEHGTFRGEAKAFKWVIGILIMTVVAGRLARFPATRNLRALFLVGGVAVLGFYKGGCPCPIQSLQYAILNLLGHSYKWQTIVYFTALIPITYFLGRVYCGWICGMGALQEVRLGF